MDFKPDSPGRMYIEKFGLKSDQLLPQDRDWTPAEIKATCRLASLFDDSVQHAAQYIVPIAVTAGESVEKLRNWASGRCLAADQPGIYTRASGGSNPPSRPANRDPSRN